ncbi:hypothetical protein TRP8649_02141 [Pelagimonas phthalicica]|uniref:Uncharacterized protein n=1 Tax=Pelagimonas phthalicica TaxID=1037362 RepID=A0A238JBQ6_9RHOB|nr:hypothetical protein [Pelagimonas phthalicica]TDS90982.1 hypothetical protein CLV87_2143 [Pelagimonas phthalicica]SMX28029.1 hypothetical protein TRP8649_02141 [Pelagimonas phthalicica]
MTAQLKTLFFAAALATGAFASSAHAFGEHYLCYNIDPHGGFKEIPVELKDQFAGYKGLVIRPVSLCNPVDKNGEGIREPEVHLVCYEIKAEPVTKTKPAIDVMTANQFREQSMTAVLPPHTLCVPSKKEHL